MNSGEKIRYILLKYPGDTDQVFFDQNARDNCTEPYIFLRQKCSELGYKVEAAALQPLRDTAWLLFWDIPSVTYGMGLRGFLRRMRFSRDGRARDWIRQAKKNRVHCKMALFLMEPPSVCPENWESRLYEEFQIIFSWNDRIVDGVKIHKIFYPIPINVPKVQKENFSSKKLLVNISANKFSVYPHELYSARRDVIRYSEKVMPQDFDLYGVGWDHQCTSIANGQVMSVFHQPYTSYRGQVKNKWDVLPNYKFAISYENVSNQPGFITEKIFDCMRADCVPIYWGAPNIADYVDPEAFIDRRKFHSNEELLEFISGIDEKQYERYREAIHNYLNSEKFQVFLSPAFVQNIITTLDLCPL